MGPTVLQGTLLGPRVLGAQNLTTLSVFFGFTRGINDFTNALNTTFCVGEGAVFFRETR